MYVHNVSLECVCSIENRKAGGTEQEGRPFSFHFGTVGTPLKQEK